MLAVIWCAESLVFHLISRSTKIKIYRTIILPVLLYGWEIWSLTLRERRRLRLFEKRVLRRIFGPTRSEVTREWRQLHNDELNDLYFSPNIVRVIKSRRMRWVGHVAHMGERRGVHRVLVGKPEGKIYLEDPAVDGMIILRWVFSKWDVGSWTERIKFRIGTGDGHLQTP